MGKWARVGIYLILSMSVQLRAGLAVEVKAEGAILIEANSGAVLYSKNAHDRYYPASITKIATALLALELAEKRLDEMVKVDHDSIAWMGVEAKRRSRYTVPAYWLEPGSSHIGLKKGEQLSLQTLLYGLMLASGDDAANAIAKYVGGDVPAFMQSVNARLDGLGCLGTHFNNPHGLFHPNHYTTASDMALLTQEAMRNLHFRKIVQTARYPRPRTEMQEASIFTQTNKLLRSGPYHYPYAVGVKTGYISAAQHTLVAAAEKEGRLLIAVLLKSQERADIFRDAVSLFEAAFAEPLMEKALVKKGPQPFRLELSGGSRPVETYVEEEIAFTYYPSAEPSFTCHLHWDPSLMLPVAAEQKVGFLTIVSHDGQIQRQVDLKARSPVEETWWHALQKALQHPWTFSQLLATAALALFIALGVAMRSRY